MSSEKTEQEFGQSTGLPKVSEGRLGQLAPQSQTSSRRASYVTDAPIDLDIERQLSLESDINLRLGRRLSTMSVVSTSSSFAQRQEAADPSTVTFRSIGTGSVGNVFEHPGTTWIYKLPLLDDTRKLWNNYIVSGRIAQSFDELGLRAGQVEIPRALWYATPDTDSFWIPNLDRFDWTSEFASRKRDVLCLERIFPLPKPTREYLIDMFFPEVARDSAKANTANKDCLVRLYFGRNRQSSRSRMQSYSLRNYRLYANQIANLELNSKEIISSMADAMAVLHWHTKIDAMDIEFVLGSSPSGSQVHRRNVPLSNVLAFGKPSSTFEHVTNAPSLSFKQRVTSLWLLDFDACGDITMDQAGVDQACKAFMENDPYCPRPNTEDISMQYNWKGFGNRYLTTAERIDKAPSSTTVIVIAYYTIIIHMFFPRQEADNRVVVTKSLIDNFCDSATAILGIGSSIEAPQSTPNLLVSDLGTLAITDTFALGLEVCGRALSYMHKHASEGSEAEHEVFSNNCQNLADFAAHMHTLIQGEVLRKAKRFQVVKRTLKQAKLSLRSFGVRPFEASRSASRPSLTYDDSIAPSHQSEGSLSAPTLPQGLPNDPVPVDFDKLPLEFPDNDTALLDPVIHDESFGSDPLPIDWFQLDSVSQMQDGVLHMPKPYYPTTNTKHPSPLPGYRPRVTLPSPATATHANGTFNALIPPSAPYPPPSAPRT